MNSEIKIENRATGGDKPAGGSVRGPGIEINWQSKPVPKGESPKGAMIEDILEAVLIRLNFYQECGSSEDQPKGKFWCIENKQAIEALEECIEALHSRTARRVDADIEGTHVETQSEDETDKVDPDEDDSDEPRADDHDDTIPDEDVDTGGDSQET